MEESQDREKTVVELTMPTTKEEIRALPDEALQVMFDTAFAWRENLRETLEERRKRGRPDNIGQFIGDADSALRLQAFGAWLKMLGAELKRRAGHPIIHPITGQRYESN